MLASRSVEVVCPLSKTETHKTVDCLTSVNCSVVGHVPFATKDVRQPQKKGLSPPLNCLSFVVQCVSAPSVSTVHSAVHDPLVGGCLQPFWQNWAHLGANPRVVSILKEGYLLPFKLKPPLVRYPLIVGGYAHLQRNTSLKEAIQTLLHKKAVEIVRVRASLAFFNRLFIVPKPNQKWRPILDLSAPNKFLSVKTFKMETPETIRISLQQGEWVTSLDFSDAYFHIPIHPGSRKYLRFHFQNQSYQFRVLPFGLSTALMEFTCVVKEVKLMAQARDIRIHQYLDDWLIRAPTRESCHQGTPSLLALCQKLGWVVNLQKSELEPKQIFQSVGYKYDLSQGLVQPTQNRWESILQKVESILSIPSCRVRQFMSMIGLLTATEKQVPLGRLHMRPIQWHLKKTLESSRDSSSKVSSPTSSMVDQGVKCLDRTASAPFVSCHSNLYRRLKRRLGCSLRRLHGKRHLVSSRKPSSHKLPGTKSCLTSLEKIPAPSTRKSRSGCHRQHHSCGIHQQGGRYEVRLTLCPSMVTPVLVQSETGCSKGQAHPWSSECDCRQTVSSRPSHSDRMVPSAGSFQPSDSDLAPFPSGHVCNKVQLQTRNRPPC